jgi:dsRNA-specific ribonuclease
MNVKFNDDRTKFWKSYFPVRNGIKPETFLGTNGGLGKNYTNETLHYMSKANTAKLITDKIETYLNSSPYFMIDMTAGIGGNTLDFLSRKNCVSVMSFEKEPLRRLMLARNINGYNLGDKAIVPNLDNVKDVIPVSGEEDFSDYRSSLFFFDPPWLPESFKGGKDYKKHYILRDIKIGSLTLEQWLGKLLHNLPDLGSESEKKKSGTKKVEEINYPIAYMVIFRVPPEYVLDPVEGWTYVIEELGNDGRLYICIPNFYIKGAKENVPGETIYTTSDSEVEDGTIVSKSKRITSLMMNLKPIPTDLTSQYSNFRNSCNALSLKDFSKAANEEKCKIFVKWGFRDPDPEGKNALNRVALKDQGVSLISSESQVSGGAGSGAKGNIPLQIKKDEYNTPPTLISEDNKNLEPSVLSQMSKNKTEGSRFTNKKIPIDQQVPVFVGAPKLSKKFIDGTMDKNSPEFISEFQSYINWLLRLFIKKDDDINRLLESESMIKWIQAFTHDSYDPSRNRNYDLLEIIGDRASEYIFSKLLVNLIYREGKEPPDANKITQYKKEYMSETWQTLVGKSLGFKDWIRIRDPFNDKLYEDVLESFIGALSYNGDAIRGFGYGINLCDKFIKLITSKIMFDEDLAFGDPKTNFSQRFETAFGSRVMGKIIENTAPMGSSTNTIVIVKLTVLTTSLLENERFAVPESRIIGKGIGNNLTEATKAAFQKANEYLDSIGFTNSVSREIKETRTWDDIEKVNPIIYNQAKAKLKREGYDEYTLEVSQKGTNYISKLIGYNGKDKNPVALGYGSDSDKIKAKIKAIQDYMEA